jgi:MFS family permease
MAGAPTSSEEADRSSYPRYVLGVLVAVYVLNFLDRQIVTILADEIKADLGLSDAEIGFLYGTAFAVFYALFGIPLGRLADVWNRRTLIALGLSVWSLMTALSGLARSFPQLAAARVGVGVGEASASPAAYSMLSDYFPARRRATVLAIYSSGIYIGAGLSLMIGGQVVERWNDAFATGAAPFGLEGWQVAYLVVGLPGLLLAAWVRTLREPVRGQADGLLTPPEPHPFREFFRELRAVLPPFTVLHLHLLGGGPALLLRNLAAALAIAMVSAGLVHATGNLWQWLALGVGVYSTVSWMQALRLRDPPTARLVLGSRALLYGSLGFSFLAFTGYGLGAWTPPFFLRFHGADVGTMGFVLGGTAASAGWLGVTLGGIAADRLRAGRPTGRLLVAYATALAPVPLVVWMLTTTNTTLAYVLNFPVTLLGSMWIGVGASTIQDLVLPRMRATASAFYLLVITFVGLALGPYVVGQLSDTLGSLRAGMLWAVGANGIAMILLLLAARHLEREESSRLERAREAGEPV